GGRCIALEIDDPDIVVLVVVDTVNPRSTKRLVIAIINIVRFPKSIPIESLTQQSVLSYPYANVMSVALLGDFINASSGILKIPSAVPSDALALVITSAMAPLRVMRPDAPAPAAMANEVSVVLVNLDIID